MQQAFSKDFDILDIQRKIGYNFKNWELLFCAFTHSSYANEKKTESYERLEFIGDSLVNGVVAIYLFKRYPTENEGFLTKTRAKIVSASTLSAAIEEMDIVKYVRCSCGNGHNEVTASEKVKCDLFEAITGAIMLDEGGMQSCEEFVLSKLKVPLSEEYRTATITDYKSGVLEYCAQKHKNIDFKVEASDNGGFKSELLVDGAIVGCGVGKNKKEAEQKAAMTYFNDSVAPRK